MQKMTGQTADISAENAAKIKALFPACVDAQGNIDFPALKTTLGVPVDNDKDSAANYSFVWSGKEKGRAYALAPSSGTLRPDRSKSVDFDTTKNIYIEGDNLEVLKLLRGAYSNRVKMIYIDPPYNTGKDFVYNDDYSDSIESYKKLVGLVANDGTKLKTNADTAGRYHTNWLNMMFPRLLLARDLLSDDGAIFISIDDHEYANLRKICDEVFGENNFRNAIVTRRYDKNLNRQFMDKGLQSLNVGFEYIVVYSKTCEAKLCPVFRSVKNEERGEQGYWKGFWNAADRPTMRYEVLGVKPEEGQWKWQESVAREAVENYKLYKRDFAASMTLEDYWSMTGESKRFLRREKDGKGKNRGVEHWVPPSEGILRTSNWTDLLASRPCEVPFDSPKNPDVIQELCNLSGVQGNDVIIDFFSGSATTAEAVMRLNVEDSGMRRFIMVQLPEDLDIGLQSADSSAKEMIMSAIKFCDENTLSHPDYKGDLGFKVFTLDSSNVIPWNPDPSKLDLTMRNMEKNLVAGRENEDLLFEILLKKNVLLDVDIESFEVKTEENGAETKNTVYVAGGVLFVYLDQHIPGEVSSEILKLRDKLAPETDIQVVFRETGFCDVDKTNALAILEQGGVDGGQIWTL